MNERRIASWSGQSLILRAELDDATMDWGATEVAAHAARSDAGVIVAGSGFVLGGILCAFAAEGDAFVLTEVDLSAPHSSDLPDTYVAGVTRALALAYEQHLVHASFHEAPPLRPNLFHNMLVAVSRSWDHTTSFVAYRSREGSIGSHTGWIVRSNVEDEADAEVAVRDVIQRRPMLRRFLTWAPGTAIRWSVGFLDVSVDRGEEMYRLWPTKGSYVETRLEDKTPIPFDPVAHAAWIARAREASAIVYSMAELIAEEQFVSRAVAQTLAGDVRRYVAADRLYVLAFVRQLRQWLRQGREPIALQEIARAGELTPEEAKAFLDRHRGSITEGKIPPRD